MFGLSLSNGIYMAILAVCVSVVIVGGVHLADKLWEGGRAEAQREIDAKLAQATQVAEAAGDSAKLAHDSVPLSDAFKTLRREYCTNCKEAR